MPRIRLLVDAASRLFGNDLLGQLQATGSFVEVRQLARFPIGDALPALLVAELAAFDFVVVAPGMASPNRTWLLREVSHGGLYPNVLVAVASEGELPDWGDVHPARAFVAGKPLPEALT